MSEDRWRQLGRSALHLFVLTAFAFAQPLYDLFARTPEFFVARGSTRAEVFLFALALLLVPPAVLLAIEAAATLISRRAGALVHLVLVAGLVALVAMQVFKRAGVGTLAVFVLAAAAGAVGAALYASTRPVRLFLTILAPAPLVFFALFLLRSPVGKLEDTAQALPLPPPRAKPPVVLVVFDEFPIASLLDRRHRIDPVRYPHFAALSRDATWYRDATGVHEHTTEAVPAILTGLYPKPNQLPLVADHPNNLFTLLGSRYRMHVFEPVTQLCPERLCKRVRLPLTDRLDELRQDVDVVYAHLLLPKSLERRLPSISNTWEDFGGDAHGLRGGGIRAPLVVANGSDIDKEVGRQLWQDQRYQFERFVAGIEPSTEPTLHTVHVLLPHYPWRFLPSGHQYGNALGIDGLDIDTWTKDPWLVDQGWQRHLLQVGFVDRLLGELVARLKRTGIYDRSLLIVTADHGVSFIPGEHRRSITPRDAPDIASVPLLVKLPQQRRGRISDADVETVDIVPTIADVLGVKMPYRPDGRSLLARGPDRSLVTIRARTGASVTTPAARIRRGKYATLARQLRLFGDGSVRRLYDVGPNRELVGRAVAGLKLSAAGGATVSIDGANLLAHVDPAAQLSPSHLTGLVTDPRGRADLDLAVGVNGTIAAVTQTFRTGSDLHFAAFVPESVFRRGRNDVQIYRVSHAGGIHLERLRGGTAAATYALAGAALRSGGRTISIVPGALSGRVEDWFFEQQSVRFGGWAADLKQRALADVVVVFADGKFVYSGTTSVERKNLMATRNDPGLSRAGFVFDLPRSIVGDGGHHLRFFAVRGNVATELRYPRDFPWPTRP